MVLLGWGIPLGSLRYGGLTLDNSCAHDGAHPGVGVVYNSCVHCDQSGESTVTELCNSTTDVKTVGRYDKEDGIKVP